MSDQPRTIKVVQNLLVNNDLIADEIHKQFNDAGVLAVNIIASPGAGKTSLIVKTMEVLRGRAAIGVIEGDVAGSIDTEKVLAAGAKDAVQINTGGNCHLEAGMVQQAIPDLKLGELDIVFIENVGNLICPNHWNLGQHLKLCLISTAEGDDKPIKYPEIFAASDIILVNKIDLIELVDFDREFFYQSLKSLNPDVPVFELSCRTGEGFDTWVDWLLKQNEAY